MGRCLPFLLILFLGLAACDTAEERAQGHYENALALLAEGDPDRALIELRNALQLNESHRDARLAFAGIEEERGNVAAAYGQYLKIVEQTPQDLDGRRALARIAARLNNWDEVERHVTVAYELAPADPQVLAVRAGLDYRRGLQADDSAATASAVQVAGELLDGDPALSAARRVVIDDLLRRQDWEGALTAIDAGLEQAPDSRGLYNLRLGLLERLGREDAIEAQLLAMIERFPEEDLHRALLQWYVSRGRVDAAEDFLRSRVDPAAEDPQARLDLVGFLAQQKGRDAALAEIETALAENTANPDLFRAVRAGFAFEAGDRNAAITDLEALVEAAEPSEQTNRIKIDLARMLFRTGNAVGARARVEEVLQADPTQVDALKLKAGWLIEDDRTSEALVELRQTLDQAPRDVEALTLMALAHERAGNRDLMGEMLALAVEAAGGAPAEALRYAEYLIQQDDLLPAEDVLQDALRAQPGNSALLGALGNVYLRLQDWPRTDHVIETLNRLDDEAAMSLATELTARKLAGQNRQEELEGFLAGLADSDSGLQAAASIIRLRLGEGDVEGALAYVDELRAAEPDNPALRFVEAGVLVAAGRPEDGLATFRALATDFPQNERIWMALYNLHRSQGDEDAARAALAEGLEAAPQSANLRWMQASEAERAGDIDQAIEIYEGLYAENSGSVVVANNLASLISTHRSDDESLRRAFEIARRLRGTDVPAFQDTYGWIAHRLGNHEEAREYLVTAAEGLPNDPRVQFHRAEMHAALGETEAALTAYTRAAELVAERGGARPGFMDRLEAQVTALQAAPEN